MDLQPEVLSAHTKRVSAIAFSPDGQTLATGAEEATALLWDISTRRVRATLPGHDRIVSRLGFSPNGRNLETGSFERFIRLWDVRSGELRATFEHKEFISAVAFAPDSHLVATASLQDLTVKLWNVDTAGLEGNLLHEIECRTCGKSIGSVAFSSDGKTLASSGFRRVYLWDISTRQLRATLVDDALQGSLSHGSTIYAIAFSPSDRVLATASRDGSAKLWDVASGRLRTVLLGHKGRVHRIVFSPDGRTIATGSDDRTAKLWDVATGQLKATLKHRGTVWSIGFSPDSKVVGTGADNDHSVKLWDATSGDLLATLNQARYPLAFSPDRRTLATAGEKGVVLLWEYRQVLSQY